uniref:Uncharacterized protein n=1 Tax=Myoviridae sp. ctCo31 TaxID=2825053 RepID=A0A8S5UMT8_9CAUD|nr:MAG TPA: hypothetical protein [Myoviridae sp. ctCo31]
MLIDLVINSEPASILIYGLICAKFYKISRVSLLSFIKFLQ